MTNLLKAATAAFLCCVLLTPQTANAEPPFRTVSVPVAYGDLDLSSPAGARALLSRLRIATRKICGDTPAPPHLAANVRHKTCTRSAMTRAVATLDHPVVNAAYHGRRAGVQTAAR